MGIGRNTAADRLQVMLHGVGIGALEARALCRCRARGRSRRTHRRPTRISKPWPTYASKRPPASPEKRVPAKASASMKNFVPKDGSGTPPAAARLE
jgi:hypothetical protein